MHVLALRLSIAGDAPASPKGQYLVDLEAAATLHPRKLFAEGKTRHVHFSDKKAFAGTLPAWAAAGNGSFGQSIACRIM